MGFFPGEPPPGPHPCAVGFGTNGRDCIPLRGLSGRSTVNHGPGAPCRVSAPTPTWCTTPSEQPPRVNESAAPVNRRVKPPVNRAHFVEKPPLFPVINPQSSPVQFKLIFIQSCFYSFRTLTFPEIVRPVQISFKFRFLIILIRK